MNTSAWSTCRELLERDNSPYLSAHVLMIQETKLRSPEDIQSARAFLSAVGFTQALFGPALLTESAGLSGGVCLAVKSGCDIGVAPLRQAIPSHLQHRVIGAVLEAPGLVPHAAASMYSVPRIGLTGANLELLGWAATTQDEEQLPVLIGGDFNYEPPSLEASDFSSRSGLQPLAPAEPTHIKRDSRRVLDWFLVSEPLRRLVDSVVTLSSAPLAPHRPVRMQIQLDQEAKVPILVTPQKLPRHCPVGPLQEVPPWTDLEALTDGLRQSLEAAHSDSPSSLPQFQSSLDMVYDQLVRATESAVARLTDTTLSHPGTRALPPRVKWVSVKHQCRTARKSWRSHVRPLVWLQNSIDNLYRAISHSVKNGVLMEHVEFCQRPDEFLVNPQLSALYAKCETVFLALLSDERQGYVDRDLSLHVIDHLSTQIREQLSRERGQAHQSARQAWRQWVKEAMSKGVGWAHRWSKPTQPWQPAQVLHNGKMSGRPSVLLAAETSRLEGLWRCSANPQPPVPPASLSAQLPPPLSQ